ncbi:hypothetical protein Tco_1485791 [Tanacetum coccineum]
MELEVKEYTEKEVVVEEETIVSVNEEGRPKIENNMETGTSQENNVGKEETKRIKEKKVVAEVRLEATLEELDTIISSQAKALGDLRNLISTTLEARAKAWVEALKANEKEIDVTKRDK